MTVRGYASVTSVAPNDSIDFHLSSDTPGPTDLVVDRVGTAAWARSSAGDPMLFDPQPPMVISAQALPPNAWEGFGWSSTTSFTVPADWPSGLYRLVAGDDEVLTFVVRPSGTGSTSRVLVLIEFLTIAAYNPAGGKSLYGFNSGGPGSGSPLPAWRVGGEDNRATAVSLLRGKADWDYGPAGLGKYRMGERLITWLESESILVEYCSSIDLHTNSALLDDYDCLVIAGHDEYWTRAMRDNTERFVANGGNMIVLSGNTCIRAVRLEQNNTLVVFHKYPASDSSSRNEDATVGWADPPLNRPTNTLFGTGWTSGAFSGPATAYTIRFPSHWVFAGIPGPTQTPAFMTYETDAASYVEEPEGYPRVTGEDGSPLAFTVLASADLRSWSGKPGYATMGMYSRNGTVFNVASTDWLSNSTFGVSGDPVVNQVTRNVFQRLRTRVPWNWEDIGHANFGRAMTSLGGKLFIATSENRLYMRHPVGADVPWRLIGHANNVIAMAGAADTLYCVTSDNQMWWRPPVEDNVNWTPMGNGPAGTRALAAAGGMLYATDASGKLHRTPAKRQAPAWSEIATFAGHDARVIAMSSYADILFASTDDNRLLRSPSDWVDGDTGWSDIWHCNFSVGLAVVEWMLFVATTENRLWRLDLAGLRQP